MHNNDGEKVSPNRAASGDAAGRAGGWRPLFSGIDESGKRQNYGLYSSAELNALVEYERRRSDRNGEPNTMLVCYLNGSYGKERVVRRIVEAIRKSVRETDHVGWLNEAALGVLLPGTSAEAAELLKQKLERSGLEHVTELRIEPV